jgi:ferredoxin/flavodoxin---NADP+ reductase
MSLNIFNRLVFNSEILFKMMTKEVKPKTQILLTQVLVKGNDEIATGVFILRFRRTFDFIGGQVIGICLEPEGDPRLYSIASGTNDEDIQVLYNIKPTGKLTPPLARVKVGDSIYITPPFGSYFGSEEPAWWIASGTGIAPFYSMFRSGLGADKVLLHGGRFREFFYFQDELLPVLKENYIRCSSREKGEGLFPGRLTDYLKQHPNLPANIKYYLCGSAEMVVDARDILISKGIPFANIVSEIYF